jgi:hypothetical protein
VDQRLSGSAIVLLLYDVAEEIRLEELRRLLVAQRLQPAFKHAAPQYVGFEHPPAVEPLSASPDGVQAMAGEIKYYDYGVVSLMLQRDFRGSWSDLVQLSAEWLSGTAFDEQARAILKDKLGRAAPALVKPYQEWLSEDYFIFQINNDSTEAEQLLHAHGPEIAQIVRGETGKLSQREYNEVLQSSISYYADDLAVIGWNAAFLYDTPAGAATAVQLLEYANTQLLEFRHYDDYLTQELSKVYRMLDQQGGLVVRWRLARAASKLHATTLDVTELTERVDNAIKFLSDMFAARLHSMAATKVGVSDYKDLVEQKLQTARELYSFMVEQFQHSRAFVLELMVVIILVIELVFLFRGK